MSPVAPRLLACGLLGFAHGASFALDAGYWLHFGALAGIGVCLLGARRASAVALDTFVFFSCSFATGLAWLAQGLAQSTGLGPLLALVVCFALCVFLAAIPALAMGAIAFMPERTSVVLRAIAAAGLLSIAEIVRALWLTGFPWLINGQVYVDGPLAAWLSIVGTHGVGAIAFLTAFMLAILLKSLRERLLGVDRWGAVATLLGLGIITVLLPAQPSGEGGTALRASLVQPAIDLHAKFDSRLLADHMDTLATLGSDHRADIVVAPETAVPATWDSLPSALHERMSTAVRNSGATWLLGALDTQPNGELENVVVALRPEQSDWATTAVVYRKRHLVPFAEYAPRGFGWFADLLALPVSSRVHSEEGAAPFSIRGTPIASTICLDLMYPLDERGLANGGLIINHANFAWVTSPIARRQFLSAARARALEMGMPILIAANDGPTAGIDATGAVRALLPFGEVGVLTTEVRIHQTATPYARVGLLSYVCLLIVMSLLALLCGKLGSSARLRTLETVS